MAKACEVARVARSEHYRWLRYRRYAARFREAEEHAIQALETEARRRAMVGIEKPIFYKGHAVTYVRAFSDGLLMFLLKAKRPGHLPRPRAQWPRTRGIPITPAD